MIEVNRRAMMLCGLTTRSTGRCSGEAYPSGRAAQSHFVHPHHGAPGHRVSDHLVEVEP
jgi:hypothetical protein